MTVRQYIGARYVPIFSDPIQWDSTKSYEPLTVVMNQGTSYVSKQSVPAGIQINNETYWLRWADYNAQLEEYIRQVQTYSASITALNDALPIANFDSNDTVKDTIDALTALLPGSAFDSTNTIDARFDTIESNNWVNTNRIADDAVTTSKINDSAVTTAKLANDSVSLSKIQDSIFYEQVIIIGDSWVNADKVTPGYIQALFGVKSTQLHNFSVNGAGFFRVGFTTFSEQLANAIADSTVDKRRRTAIIIAGGINDSSSTASDYITRIGEMQAAIDAAFINAKTVFFFKNKAKNADYQYSLIRNVQAGANANVANYSWILSNEYFNDSDIHHPTNAGYKVVARYIASCFGIGQFPSVLSTLGSVNITSAVNALTDCMSIINYREWWTEESTGVQIFATPKANLNANGLNGAVSATQNSPIKMSSYYIHGKAPSWTTDGDGNITEFYFEFGGGNFRIRNATGIANGATYMGEAEYHLTVY